MTEEEIAAKIADLENRVNALAKPGSVPEPQPATRSIADHFWRFVGSGFFFMIIGALFLWIAQYYMGFAHAAFSFVLVVVGVAILLYGTGTQGIGEFNSDAGTAKYKVALAGGAGVLAFCVALGIIHFHGQMKEAFQVERKYVWLTLAGNDGVTNLARLRPHVEMDGVPVPVRAHRDDSIGLLLPYFAQDFRVLPRDATPSGENAPTPKQTGTSTEGSAPAESLLSRTIVLLMDVSSDRSGTLNVPTRFALPVKVHQSKIVPNTGWLDFPRVEEPILVSFKDSRKLDQAVANTSETSNDIQGALAKRSPDNVEPLIQRSKP